MQRRFRVQTHRLGQRGPRVLEQRGNVFQARAQRGGPGIGRAVATQQQVMESAEQMTDPELRVLGLRALLLEAVQRDPNLVEQRGAVDLVVEVVGAGFLERAAERLERREVGA